MTITVRRLHGDEILHVVPELDGYAFLPTPPIPDRTTWKEWLEPRYGGLFMALFDDDKPMAVAASRSMTENVRGKLFPMGGISSVSAIPEGRRKGYTKRLLTELLAAIRDEERPFSTLYPFRESFYSRMGFATFPQARVINFATAHLAPVLKFDLNGTIKRLPIEEGRDLYQAYLKKYQPLAHGFAVDDITATRMKKLWLALAHVEGETTGVMTYLLEGPHGDFTCQVRHFYYHDSQARYLMLEWLARHIDQATSVNMRMSPAEVPETWLPDLDLRISSGVKIGEGAPMGRVIDVMGIGGMQTGPGQFSAQISDSLCPWNDGAYHFETVDGLLQVRKASDADCVLTIQALSTLVYGTHDPADFVFHGWGNPPPELQATMRGMFPRMMPHLHERF